MKKFLFALILGAGALKAVGPEVKQAQDEIQVILNNKAEEQRRAIQKRGEQNWYRLESLIEAGLAGGILSLLRLFPMEAKTGDTTIMHKALLIYRYLLAVASSSVLGWVAWKMYRDTSDDNCLQDKLAKLDERHQFLANMVEYTKQHDAETKTAHENGATARPKPEL